MDIPNLFIFWLIVIALFFSGVWIWFFFRLYQETRKSNVLLEHMDKFMLPLAGELKELGYSDDQIRKKISWAYSAANYRYTYPASILRDHISYIRQDRDFLAKDLANKIKLSSQETWT